MCTNSHFYSLLTVPVCDRFRCGVAGFFTWRARAGSVRFVSPRNDGRAWRGRGSIVTGTRAMGRRRSRVASKIALTIATDQLNGVQSVLSPANVHKHIYILKICTCMKKGETAAHGCRKKANPYHTTLRVHQLHVHADRL